MPNYNPPNPPWKEIEQKENPGGSLSFYHSDNLSKIPIRYITKIGDNKADPNFETLTYGMFSTCEKALRAGFVERGYRYLFFTTRWKGRRVLTGYYSVKWYTTVANADSRDYALAAESAFFMSNPLTLEEIDKLCNTHINKRFRLYIHVSEEDCNRLVQFFQCQTNAMEEYLSEIYRLEQFNKAQGGYKYIGRKLDESFSWCIAKPYIVSESDSKAKNSQVPKNSSPSDWWKCTECFGTSKNKALLRICPNCGMINTLKSMDLPPVQ